MATCARFGYVSVQVLREEADTVVRERATSEDLPLRIHHARLHGHGWKTGQLLTCPFNAVHGLGTMPAARPPRGPNSLTSQSKPSWSPNPVWAEAACTYHCRSAVHGLGTVRDARSPWGRQRADKPIEALVEPKPCVGGGSLYIPLPVCEVVKAQSLGEFRNGQCMGQVLLVGDDQ